MKISGQIIDYIDNKLHSVSHYEYRKALEDIIEDLQVKLDAANSEADSVESEEEGDDE